jgi:uncharacterized protein (TIGR02466 family)
MKIENLFPTEIGVDKLDDPQLIADLLKEGLTTNQSSNLWTLNTPAINKAKAILEQKVNEYAKAVGFERELESTRGWIRVYKFGGYTSAHHHAYNSFISACLYLKANGDGRFVMHDPRGSISWLDTEPKNHARPKDEFPTEGHTYPGSNTNKVEPQTGMIIIFPGWLNHSVEPNLSNQERIVLASNYNFRK